MPLTLLAAAPLAVLVATALALTGWTAAGRGLNPSRPRGWPQGWPPVALGAAGLGVAFAATAWQLAAIGGGSVVDPLWSLAPHLPLTIRADPTAGALLLVGLVCAGLAGLPRRPADPWATVLTVAAAASGALVACAGDLVTLWVGLVLTSLAAFGLVWRAEAPRLAPRSWLGVAVTFAADLAFLAAVLTVWRSAGTTDYAVIPPGSVGPGLLALLLAPGVVRLTGAWTVRVDGAGGGRRGAGPRADGGWFAVATVPVGLAAIVRVIQLGGATWPPSTITGGLVAIAILSAAVGGVTALWPRPTVARGVRGALLAEAGIALAAFAQGGPDGIVLGTAAALVVALTAVVLPALPAWTAAAAGGGAGPVALLVAGSTLPPTLGFGLGVLLVAVASTGARLLGLAILLAWIAGLPAMASTALAIRRAVGARARPVGLRGTLQPGAVVAAGLLLGAACAPAAVLRFIAPAVAGGAAAGSRLAGSTRWLSDGVAGITWPGGELAAVAALGLALWWSLGALAGGRVPAEAAPAPAGPSPAGVAASPPTVAGRRGEGRAGEAILGRLRRHITGPAAAGLAATTVAAGLAARALAEQPEWLWLAAAAWMVWLVVVR